MCAFSFFLSGEIKGNAYNFVTLIILLCFVTFWDFSFSSLISNEGAIRELGAVPLQDLINDLGGWPVTEGPNWKPKLTIEELIGKFISGLFA